MAWVARDKVDRTITEAIVEVLQRGILTVDFEAGAVLRARVGPGHSIRLVEPQPAPTRVLNRYLRVEVRLDGKRYHLPIHRVVWIAAHGLPPPDMHIHHVNHDKLDNRLANLALVTPLENTRACIDAGRWPLRRPMSGGFSRRDRQIRGAYATGEFTMKELAELFGLSHTRIEQIIYTEPRLPQLAIPAGQAG